MTILIEKRDAALWLTINRPLQRNALNQEVITGLTQGFEQAQADKEVRVIVLTGAGEKAFCAGADLNPNQAFVFDYAEPTSPYANLLRLAQNCALPTLAVINGSCIAGGMGLAAMCDLAIAVDEASFSLPEVALGIFPMQVLSVLQPLVSKRVLREWCLLGEPFTAQQALDACFLNAVVKREELEATAQKFISRLSTVSPTAIRRGKYAMRAIEDMSFAQSIAFTEGQLALLANSEDATEGLKAFSEKRKPNFTGT